MSELANQFSTIFRDEHRAVRDALFELSDTFRRGPLKIVGIFSDG